MLCRPYSARFLHSVSDQMQNLPNNFTTPNKMTSDNDIKGLVSLKFLYPWENSGSFQGVVVLFIEAGKDGEAKIHNLGHIYFL